VLTEFGASNLGTLRGTIRGDMRLRFVSNDVRRHRLMSISYISLLPCHGTVRWNGREREDRREDMQVSDLMEVLSAV